METVLLSFKKNADVGIPTRSTIMGYLNVWYFTKIDTAVITATVQSQQAHKLWTSIVYKCSMSMEPPTLQ